MKTVFHTAVTPRPSALAVLIVGAIITACGGGDGDESARQSSDELADRSTLTPATGDMTVAALATESAFATARDTSSLHGVFDPTVGQSSAVTTLDSDDVASATGDVVLATFVSSAVFLNADSAAANIANQRQTVLAADDFSAAAADNCSVIPAIPAPPANAKKVTDYGAKPDDNIDDTAAIQSAIDKLKTGEWLVFPPGRYLHNNTLRVRAVGATLYGKGATLHATNPEAMAVMLSADNTSLFGFTLTAVTDVRRSEPWNARISVFKDDYSGNKLTASNIRIQGNVVTYAGAPGTSTANSASSAGIYLYKVDKFLVAQNTVNRSLADGIHIQGSSHNGRVVQNKVRETGDDMISVVSFAQGAPAALQTAAALKANWDSAKAAGLNSNIVISGNDVAGNYWGRGITVIGGEAVTIKGNLVSSVAGAAGIMLDREQVYRTFGVNNIVVDGNTVEKIQSVPPVYNPGNKFKSTTRQGSIEAAAYLFTDELADPFLADQLSVRNVLLKNNTIRDAVTGGVRTGAPLSGTMSAVNPATGATVYRSYRNGLVKLSSIQANTMTSLSYGLSVISGGTQTTTTACAGNLLDGVAPDQSMCLSTTTPAITGAKLTCGSNGMPM